MKSKTRSDLERDVDRHTISLRAKRRERKSEESFVKERPCLTTVMSLMTLAPACESLKEKQLYQN